MTTSTKARHPAHRTPAAVWTIDEVRTLGATVDVETAGTILGIGRRYLVPTPSILALLGIE